MALFLILTDIAGILPSLLRSPSDAPELNRPTQPGDQTRRYRPSNPTQPGVGIDPNMPSQLTLTTQGIDTVHLRGAIAPGDGDRIAAELRRIAPAIVTLDSPGGSVSDALDIGRALRGLGAATQITDDSVCLSACPYIFAGGLERSIEDGGRLGVHQHSFGESVMLPAFLATQDIQSGQAEVLAHLDDMGINLRIMGPALATPANEIYILTRTELSDWNVGDSAAVIIAQQAVPASGKPRCAGARIRRCRDCTGLVILQKGPFPSAAAVLMASYAVQCAVEKNYPVSLWG